MQPPKGDNVYFLGPAVRPRSNFRLELNMGGEKERVGQPLARWFARSCVEQDSVNGRNVYPSFPYVPRFSMVASNELYARPSIDGFFFFFTVVSNEQLVSSMATA